ncbi:hypothetical protein HPP92_017444 [Vanilla planifolia]|uniref:N-end aminoacyl transferase N-terminal domain-containing protein n=1 Tax=Vanilla planifolia TaxID=51239 RepID=A0A835UQK6_VANPL|nr:hypothetical protein HPP92_017444 [Vanilla planifolia]
MGDGRVVAGGVGRRWGKRWCSTMGGVGPPVDTADPLGVPASLMVGEFLLSLLLVFLLFIGYPYDLLSLLDDLLDRGWRRSGCFLYKPEMERTCCPSYTIRLKACDFVPSKEQIRVQKRMQRFLDGTLVLRKANEMGAMKSSKCHSFIKNSSASGSSISIGESSCRRNEKHKEEDLLLVFCQRWLMML